MRRPAKSYHKSWDAGMRRICYHFYSLSYDTAHDYLNRMSENDLIKDSCLISFKERFMPGYVWFQSYWIHLIKVPKSSLHLLSFISTELPEGKPSFLTWIKSSNWSSSFQISLWNTLFMCNLSDILQCKSNYAVIQSLSHVQLFVTPWTVACQTSLSFTISQSLLKLMSIELVILSNHLILCQQLLLLPSIFPSIRSFPMSQLSTSGGQSIGASASASTLPMNTQGWFPLGLTGLSSLQCKGLSRAFSSSAIQKHQFKLYY